MVFETPFTRDPRFLEVAHSNENFLDSWAELLTIVKTLHHLHLQSPFKELSPFIMDKIEKASSNADELIRETIKEVDSHGGKSP